MSLTDVRLNQLLRTNIDGVPLDLASRLLPWRTRLQPALAIHVHLHAKMQTAYAPGRSGRIALPTPVRTECPDGPGRSPRIGDPPTPLESEQDPVGRLLRGQQLHRLGFASEGSPRQRITSTGSGRRTPGTSGRTPAGSAASPPRGDHDSLVRPGSRVCRAELSRGRPAREARVLPLLLDLLNPRPGTGWQNHERASLLSRGPADPIAGPGFVHHLAIANNIPLLGVAEFLHQLGRSLIIEFVPKDDPQVARLLANREDIFENYHQDEFERCFREYFDIEASDPIPDSGASAVPDAGQGRPDGPGSSIPF